VDPYSSSSDSSGFDAGSFDPIPANPQPGSATDSGGESSSSKPLGYWAATKTASYGFLAALPLFLLYEGLILTVNANQEAQIRIGADLWIKQLLAAVGGGSPIVLGVLVLLIGVFIFVRERKKNIPLRSNWFMGILAESTLYAIVTALLVSITVGWLFAMVGGPQNATDQLPTTTMLVLSIGAGLYEELVFRVVLVGGLFWVFRHSMKGQHAAYIVAAVLGAAVFSAVHYIGPLGDAFTMPSFTFRFLFGLVLNGLFLARGFGVAAWTHAIYDILVVTELLG